MSFDLMNGMENFLESMAATVDFPSPALPTRPIRWMDDMAIFFSSEKSGSLYELIWLPALQFGKSALL
jgi:hypothetical protein